MSAISRMSEAIRLQIEANSPSRTLSGLSHDTLAAFVQIVGAFYADLTAELERREQAEQRELERGGVGCPDP